MFVCMSSINGRLNKRTSTFLFLSILVGIWVHCYSTRLLKYWLYPSLFLGRTLKIFCHFQFGLQTHSVRIGDWFSHAGVVSQVLFGSNKNDRSEWRMVRDLRIPFALEKRDKKYYTLPSQNISH